MSLEVLVSPASDLEAMTVVGLLKAYGIPCHVRGGGFGALNPGPRIDGFNGTAILVPTDFLSAARDLLAAVPIDTDEAAAASPPAQSTDDQS